MPNFGLGRRTTAPGEQHEAINWRRGFFRVWVLLSAAWIMGWGIYLVLEGVQGGFASHAATAPIILLGPPVALFLFGLAAAWAARGFRVDT